MCRFIETIRIEKGQACNLALHNRRLNDTLEANGIHLDKPVMLEDYIKPETFWQRTKCHVEYGHHIESVTYTVYHPRVVHSLRMVEADGLDYHFKYADRTSLDELFNQRGEADDVLLIKDGRVTDTTIANVALFDGEHWFTPSRPLLEGTKRRQLLDAGILSEKDIMVSDLFSYHKLCTLNAMLSFREMEIEITTATIIQS